MSCKRGPREKAVNMEMLMFSGLEAQGEISRLLDEIYGGSERATLGEATRCSRAPESDLRRNGAALCLATRRSARDSRVVEA